MKQYIVVCGEGIIPRLTAFFNNDVQFIEVEGMNTVIDGKPYQMLLTPLKTNITEVERHIELPAENPTVE